MSKMDIWDRVSKTDPAHTKKVNQRGGFTAIDAHYQIMEATREFGPVGVGWGYVCGSPIFNDAFVIVPVTIWHGSRDNTFGPIFGCAEMFGKRPDSDAPKKAMTDAITKGLSQIGFNADVFLGKFDDNKYIQERAAEEQRKQQEASKPSQDQIDNASNTLTKCETLKALQETYVDMYRRNKALAEHQDVVAAKDKRKSELEAAS